MDPPTVPLPLRDAKVCVKVTKETVKLSINRYSIMVLLRSRPLTKLDRLALLINAHLRPTYLCTPKSHGRHAVSPALLEVCLRQHLGVALLRGEALGLGGLGWLLLLLLLRHYREQKGGGLLPCPHPIGHGPDTQRWGELTARSLL